MRLIARWWWDWFLDDTRLSDGAEIAWAGGRLALLGLFVWGMVWWLR